MKRNKHQRYTMHSATSRSSSRFHGGGESLDTCQQLLDRIWLESCSCRVWIIDHLTGDKYQRDITGSWEVYRKQVSASVA